MPYIDGVAREALAAGAPSCTAGELNYVITRIINDYVKQHGLAYSVLNDVVGVLGLIRCGGTVVFVEPAPESSPEVMELMGVIKRLLNKYVEVKGSSFETQVAIDGVLGSVVAEFQRRLVEPYEDGKREENGEVYDLELLCQAHGLKPGSTYDLKQPLCKRCFGAVDTPNHQRQHEGLLPIPPVGADSHQECERCFGATSVPVVGEPISPAADKLKVYLAGGFFSHWRERLVEELPIDGYDPFSRTPQWAISLFVQGDLEAITESDLVIAYFSGGYAPHGMAAEIGWAVAHQVPVFYVDATDAPNTFMLGLAKRFFPSLGALVRWWKSCIEDDKPIL